MYRVIIITFLLILSVLLSACNNSIPTLADRINTINTLSPIGYEKSVINTLNYKFYTIHNVKNNCNKINIYFEGDGLS